MPDMKSTGHALSRLSLLVLLSAAPLAGCKTIPFAGDKTAAVESPSSAGPGTKAAAKPSADSAYVDPYVAAQGMPTEEQAGPQTLPGSEETAANIGGLATQPTGIRASQSSIFSSGIAAEPANAPRGPEGALLPSSAYAPAPGVNATLYSVYGNGNVPTGAPPPPLE